MKIDGHQFLIESQQLDPKRAAATVTGNPRDDILWALEAGLEELHMEDQTDVDPNAIQFLANGLGDLDRVRLAEAGSDITAVIDAIFALLEKPGQNRTHYPRRPVCR